jgi:acetyl-CoA carboxylase carboxyl transferase subunit alpha
MNLNYLDFEQPIAELEGKIEALESIKNKVDISQEIKKIKLDMWGYLVENAHY